MPNRIVGIDIGADSIKATFIETGFRRLTVVECREVPIPAPNEWVLIPLEQEMSETASESEPLDGQTFDSESDTQDSEQAASEPIPGFVYGLAKFIQSPGVHFDECVVALPENLVSSRVIELPFTEQKKIDQVIAIEIENYVPFDLDDMVMGYQIIEKGDASSKLLVSLAQKTRMEKFLDQLALAGLDPAVVDISSNALANATLLPHPDPTAEKVILHIGASESSVAVVSKGALAGLRAIPFGYPSIAAKEGKSPNIADLVQRLRQTFQSLRIEGELAGNMVHFSGPVATDLELREKLSDALGIEFLLYSPFGGQFVKTVADDDSTNAIFSKSLGLALRLTHISPKGQINFRSGQYTYKRAGGMLKQELPRLGIMGGILLVLLAYNLINIHLQNKKEAEQIHAQIVQVFTDNFPGQRVTNPVEQFQQNMEMVYKKYKIVGYLGDGDLQAIDVLKYISQTIPKKVKIDIKRLDIQQDRIMIEGVTDNFEMVDNIENALKKHEAFQEIKRDTATKTANEAIKFKFSIRIGRKGDSTSLQGRRSLLKGGG